MVRVGVSSSASRRSALSPPLRTMLERKAALLPTAWERPSLVRLRARVRLRLRARARARVRVRVRARARARARVRVRARARARARVRASVL